MQNIKLVEIMSVVILRTIKHFLNHKYFLIMTNTKNEWIYFSFIFLQNLHLIQAKQYENKKYIIYWSHHVSLSNHLSFHPTPLLYFKQNTGNTWLKGLYHDLWMCHDLDPTLFDQGQVYIIITHGVYPGELVICLQL